MRCLPSSFLISPYCVGKTLEDFRGLKDSVLSFMQKGKNIKYLRLCHVIMRYNAMVCKENECTLYHGISAYRQGQKMLKDLMPSVLAS